MKNNYISFSFPYFSFSTYHNVSEIGIKRLNNKHIDNRAICKNRNSPITFLYRYAQE